VKALDPQQNSVRHRNEPGSTTHQIGKNLSSNSGLPQEAEGETDHLPETASNHIFGAKPWLSVSGEGQKYCAMQKCLRYLQELIGVSAFPGK
jgi:hypothetical protein